MGRLENKVAVVYGNGAIGAAVAVAFAEEGGRVFLAGRTPSKLGQIAARASTSGNVIETAQLDALDETAVVQHLDEVVRKAGNVDISFNAVGISQKGVQGLPIADLSLDSFFMPVATYLRSHFITARAAVRQMLKQNNGVILAHTPNASRISPPFVGGMVPAWAAIEGLFRSLSVEYGASGIRTVCLHTTGIPETSLIDEVWEIHGKAHGIGFEQFHSVMEGMTHRKRLTTLKELTDASIFVASDEGSAITGTLLNLTAGMIV